MNGVLKKYPYYILLLSALVFFSCESDRVIEVQYDGGVNLEFLLPDDAPQIPENLSISIEVSSEGKAAYTEYITIYNGQAQRPLELPEDQPCVLSAELELEGEYYTGAVAVPALEARSQRLIRLYLLSPDHSVPEFYIGSPSDTITASREVTLTIKAPGAYRMELWNESTALEEGIPLVEAWEDYNTVRVWQLSPGDFMKTVFTRLVYLNGDTSGTFSDSIQPAPFNPAMMFLPDVQFIQNHNVRLVFDAEGALEMLVSNSPDTAGASWQPYSEQVDWTLAEGEGWRKAYVWFRDEFDIAGPLTDSVGVDQTCVIESFTWTNTGGNTLNPGDTLTFTLIALDDSCGLETGGVAEVTVDGWNDPVQLTDMEDGSYTVEVPITAHTPRLENAAVSAQLIDRVGNNSDQVFAEAAVTGGGYPAGYEKEFLMAGIVPVDMIWIPAGSNEMGADESEQGSFQNERPRHTMWIVQGFWLAKFEFMQWQWEELTAENPSYFQGDNKPVENTSWEEVKQLIESSNDIEGHDLWRLPSETEWEFACRAGSSTAFPWGDDPGFSQLPQYGWYTENSDFMTHETGLLLSNDWNLYDMHGNIWEWCEDWYHGGYTGAPLDGSPWLYPPGTDRSIRGGGWFNTGAQLRSARRNYQPPQDVSNQIGFRPARTEP